MFIRNLVLKPFNSIGKSSFSLCCIKQNGDNLQVIINNSPKDWLECANLFICLKINNNKPFFTSQKTIINNSISFNIKCEYDIQKDINIIICSYALDKCDIIAHGYLGNFYPELIYSLQNNTNAQIAELFQAKANNNPNIQTFQKQNEEESIKNCEPQDDSIEEKSNTFENDKQEQTSQKQLTFFEQVEPNITAILNTCPPDQTLMDKIPNSRFAKIQDSDSDFYHSVGIIFNEQNTSLAEYICYALPCKLGDNPPPDMQKFAQLLPVDDTNGYYLMYQKAQNGENVFLTQ